MAIEVRNPPPPPPPPKYDPVLSPPPLPAPPTTRKSRVEPGAGELDTKEIVPVPPVNVVTE